MVDRNTQYASVARFIEHNYRHFNAAALVDAAVGYVEHLKAGGRMMVTGRSSAAAIT